MPNRLTVATIIGMAMLLAPNAHAQTLPVRSYVTLKMAQSAATTAIAECQAKGSNITVTVLDRTGETILFLRSDRARPHHAASSRRKAYTALTFGMPSGELGPFIAKHPEAAGLGDVEGVITLGGGLPMRSGQDIVGAIGVAGASTSDADEKCAQAGIERAFAEVTP